jgi:hypothetical protein
MGLCPVGMVLQASCWGPDGANDVCTRHKAVKRSHLSESASVYDVFVREATAEPERLI